MDGNLGYNDALCWSGDRRRTRFAVMTMAEVDPKLLEILVCPRSHAPLVCEGDWLYSTDPKTRRKYPVRDALPIMLVEESVEASPE